MRDRIHRACVLGASRRAEVAPIGEVLRRDGLVVALTNIHDPSVNTTHVESDPVEPAAALAWAAGVFADRGLAFFGVEFERGRHPAVEAAVHQMGLAKLLSSNVMAAPIAGIAETTMPADVTIERVRDVADLAHVRAIDREAFESSAEISAGLAPDSIVEREDCAMFMARLDGEPVGEATAWLLEETVGIFGVAVAEHARRRGIGAALTSTAARSFGDRADLAWLLPTEMSVGLYRGLGFDGVSAYEVWGR